jgi:prolyl 4-hydroxylase
MSSSSDASLPLEQNPAYQPIDLTYPGLRMVSYNPPVYLVDNFLSPENCELLMQSTEASLVRAPVVGVGNGEISQSRTSWTCYLKREDVPSVTEAVSRLLQGKSISHIECPQVGRYLSSEEYRAHYDAFDVDHEDGRRFAGNGGQRICTVLIYLNDVANGGHTDFPLLHVDFKPTQGRALVFFPATLDGTLDKMALHGENISARSQDREINISIDCLSTYFI